MKKYFLYTMLLSLYHYEYIFPRVIILDELEELHSENTEKKARNILQNTPNDVLIKRLKDYFQHLSEKMKRHEDNAQKSEVFKNKKLLTFIEILEYSDILVQKNILEEVLDIFFHETSANPDSILPVCRQEYYYRFGCNLSLLQLAHFDATVKAINRKKGNEVFQSLLRRGGNPYFKTTFKDRSASVFDDNQELCHHYCEIKKHSDGSDQFRSYKSSMRTLNCQNVRAQRELFEKHTCK